MGQTTNNTRSGPFGDKNKLGRSGQLALKQAHRPQHAGSLLQASALLDAVPGVTGVDPGAFRIMEADGSSVVCVERPHTEEEKNDSYDVGRHFAIFKCTSFV